MGLASQLHDVGFLKPLTDGLTHCLVWLKVLNQVSVLVQSKQAWTRLGGRTEASLVPVRSEWVWGQGWAAACHHTAPRAPQAPQLHGRPIQSERGQEPYPFDVASTVS